jgi:glycosyltransferase involved in cell wall biosynthesis
LSIRVLEVANGLGVGGTEKVLQTLVKYLDRSRFDAFVCGVHEGGPRADIIREYGVEVFITPEIGDLCRKLNPDIVHVHRAGWTEPGVIEAAKEAGVPVVVETNVFGRVDTSPAEQAIDCHLFVSYFCARRYQGWVGHPLTSDKYKVLYNPVDLAGFDAHPFSGDRGRSVVGRISREENLKWDPICIDMVPLALQYVPDLKYCVIGATDEVRARIRSLGVEDHFEYLEMTADDRALMEFYDKIDVYVHGTQIGESFGCSIAEAMASRVPVVTHNCFGERDNAQVEVVDHGVTGFVADTVEDYARAVVTLLQDPGLCRKMGDAGRDKVARNYEAKKIARALEEVFEYFYEKKVRETSTPMAGG